jgi:Regulator of chromosome condensation (RCC1) repeat
MTMMFSHQRMLALFAGVLVPAAGTWACSESETLGFVDADAGADTGSSESSLPETGSDSGSRPIERAPFDPTDESVTCAVAPCAVELVAGENHFCARMSDGTVRCWGADTNGALGGSASDAGAGSGDSGASFRVGTVTDLAGVQQISAAGNTTCALREGGLIHCWGSNDTGQLGLQTNPAVVDTLAHPSATAVAMGIAAVRVDVGPQTVCAITSSGETWCWGNNESRQLARSETAAAGGPAAATLSAMKLKRTWHGSFTSFGLTDGDELVTWGAVAGPSASVAARSASISPDPSPLPIGLGGVTAFSVSSSTPFIKPGEWLPSEYIAHACAISKGEAWCWGVSREAALATGLPDNATRPTIAYVASMTAYPQRVAAAGETTCVRLTDGTVQCAGDNDRGALGRGEDAGVKFSALFKPATGFKGHAVQIAASKASVCALVQGGTVECWGSNAQGELGQGTSDLEPHASPVSVSF